MVISENFIQVPGWDERTPPNNNNNINIDSRNDILYNECA